MITAVRCSRWALYAVLLGSVLAHGAHRGWPLAVVQLGILFALLAWLASMWSAGRLEWRRTALDLPLALLVGTVVLQLLLGNRPLLAWALAPPPEVDVPARFPALFLGLGTVSPGQTLRSLLLLLTYAAVYVLVVNGVRERIQLERLVRTLVACGGLLAFLGLLDYLTRGSWLTWWHEESVQGRLAGTFANPDHFATWLGMTISLGIGHLAARRRPAMRLPLATLLRSRWDRERMIRRQLSFVALALMTLALVFTLSRGGIISLLLVLTLLLVIAGALGLARWSLVVVAALLATTLVYGAWIGLEPLIRRVHSGPADLGSRLTLFKSTASMLWTFPALGVGLGAYRDIFFRFQPLALRPSTDYYQYAHNDVLQFAVEVGVVGTLVAIFAVWRVGRDLLGAHLLGRGRCPVGGGEGESALRHEPFSRGIALGAIGAVLTLFAHSLVDFSARMPANGLLAAACLGIATVAVHTRFGRESTVVTDVRVLFIGSWRRLQAVIALGLLAASAGLGYLLVRDARVDVWLRGPDTADGMDRALSIDPGNPRALARRAGSRLEAGSRFWLWGATDTETLVSPAEQRRETKALLAGAVADSVGTLSRVPSNPRAHERLGWAHAMLALVDPDQASAHQRAAVAHLRRAVALAPENPLLHRSLAALALSMDPPLLAVGLEAGRGAVQRDPAVLPDLVERFAPYGLDAAHWLELVPPTAIDRLHLALLLEARGLQAPAHEMYGRATEVASDAEVVLTRWALARSAIRRNDGRGALSLLEAPSRLDPTNPELELARAQALAAAGDRAALEAYGSAIEKAKALRPGSDVFPLAPATARARLVVAALLQDGDPPGPLRYRRALARYLVEQQAWEDARREWEAIRDALPDDASAHFYRALALDHLGRTQPALEGYQKAIDLDGQSVPFRLRFAQRLWDADRYVQAVAEWRAVIGLAPDNVEARVAVARAHVRFGENAAALREYRELVRLAPNHPDVRRGLGAQMPGAPPAGSRGAR
jgi:tetratricopeptide (TPR) repeat protein/O-antigen ligase